jgi:hypothetical protein
VTPELLPMLKPFRQAVDAQLARIPGTGPDMAAIGTAAERRGFWIAGLTRQALVDEAYGFATTAIADGLTHQEFLDRLAETLDKQGGVLLSPQRLELIARNNTAVTYAAGRWEQINDPDILAERPYRQYPLGPHDARTSTICLKLEGLVWRAGDAIEKHVIPPNHHDERHLQVGTLTEEQAQELGIYASAGDMEYPVIEGQAILPDPGWDNAPGLLSVDEKWLAERAQSLGVALPGKTAEDYALEALADIDVSTLPAVAKDVTAAIDDIHELAQYDEAWTAFQEAAGIAEGDTQTVLVDGLGDGVVITRSSFDAMVGLNADELAREAKKDVPQWFGALKPSLEDPIETWMITRRSAAGEISLAKRYIAMYQDGHKTLLMYADVSPDGLLMDASFTDDAATIEALRRGRMIQTKVQRRAN